MKVPLIHERTGDWYKRRTTPITASLPFYQRDGVGYVHRVRCMHLHHDDEGNHTHTSVGFWCGGSGFLFPAGKEDSRKARAQVVDSPSPGRVVCATCEGRAHGAGQVGDGQVEGRFLRYRPHADFFPGRR